MNFLALLTQPYIYHGWSTQKTFWEDKFTTVNMQSSGYYNVSKHKEIKNGKQYIDLEIYLELGFLDKRKVTS